ncbi:MAG: hypothetical protein A2174_02060 [Candidatus Portnoybacteria bacterium RBG_13_41_18]|uniref:PrgI family protein n=1 Tax=Candidatus Portnoybacteria bacterium RBG_13_41_18 TaxID=1801991 RepID=A0A1G2F6W0_9BACT|nr:MAG: hypothetical protein A2174_02060 [Candidatus Portnoybacteria bacterium RBG_13_41_18]
MQFNVPQFLDIEDKIIGPLTLKQFGYLLAGGFVGFILYELIPNFSLFLLFCLPVALLAIALAFVKINGRPFIHIFTAFVNYLIKPKLYIWRKKQ